jgi:hypothetical protein
MSWSSVPARLAWPPPASWPARALAWERIFRMLDAIGYGGPISVEWEDAGMDRELGARQAVQYLRQLDFDPPESRFDAAFSAEHRLPPTSGTAQGADGFPRKTSD